MIPYSYTDGNPNISHNVFSCFWAKNPVLFIRKMYPNVTANRNNGTFLEELLKEYDEFSAVPKTKRKFS